MDAMNIQLRIATPSFDFAGVEVLEHCLQGQHQYPAGEGTRHYCLEPITEVELGLRLVVLLELNTCCLELLLEVLEPEPGRLHPEPK